MKCFSGYSLNSSQCSPVPCQLPNCQSCKVASDKCDACSQGFALNIWSGKCELTSIFNCLAFRIDGSNQKRCIKCPASTLLSSDGFSCLLNCPANFRVSNNICAACVDGYSLRSGVCVANNCSSDCTLCSSNGICLKCVNPLFTFSFELKRCASQC